MAEPYERDHTLLVKDMRDSSIVNLEKLKEENRESEISGVSEEDKSGQLYQSLEMKDDF